MTVPIDAASAARNDPALKDPVTTFVAVDAVAVVEAAVAIVELEDPVVVLGILTVGIDGTVGITDFGIVTLGTVTVGTEIFPTFGKNGIAL